MLLASGTTKMYILQYFDWNGTLDELEEAEKMVKKIIDETEGVDFKGRYSPHNKKYHWVFMFKTDSYDALMATWPKMGRDYDKMTHAVMEILQ